MNASNKKSEKAFGWAAFLLSYLLVLGLITAPIADRWTSEPPQAHKAELASLVSDRER